MYDYGARMLMPDIARWMSPDPLSEEYRRWSPYNYAVSNPLRFTDPDGNAPEDVIEEGEDDCCNDLVIGLKEGISGRIQGIKGFVSDPIGTTKNVVNNYTWGDYIDDTANSLTMGIYGTAKAGSQAIQGDLKSTGKYVSETVFDAATAGVVVKAGGAIKNIKPKDPGLGNQFKGKTTSQANKAMERQAAKGKLEKVYTDPKSGSTAYKNNKSGYSYNVDTGKSGKTGKKVEPAHIDVNYPNPKPKNMPPKKKLPTKED